MTGRAPLSKACLNGARRPGAHLALPVTPAELAHDAAEVARAGAGAVHLHVKDTAGADTLAAPELAAVLNAVRAACPLAVGVTTGAWALPDPGERVAAVRGWTALPDFASVNWHEAGAEAVAEALLERGVGVEAGLWHEDAVAAWRRWPGRGRCLRVLVELPDGLDEAGTRAEAARLLAALEDDPDASVPVLLHGEGSSAWPALRLAVERGLATRIGLEDVLTLPDGAPCSGNAELVRAAVAVQYGGGPSVGGR